MPKRLFFILCCISLFLGCAKLQNLKKTLNSMEFENIDFSQLKDGIYDGECDLEILTAKVKVTVDNGKVTKIDIIEHKHGAGYGAEKITEKVIEKGTIQVDTISGATGSSKVVLKAIENALKKGL